MQAPNVQFSPHEMNLLTDGAWILTKNGIIAKVSQGMGRLAARMQESVRLQTPCLPASLVLSNAKISKGENYGGLPYVMLDYPKVFGRTDILAIRTFFWWGRFCSICLHVKGIYQPHLLHTFSSLQTTLAEHAFLISATGDEWNHDLTGNGYQPLHGMSVAALQNASFLKIAARVDLAQWDHMEEKLAVLFEVLLKLCLNHDSRD